MEQPPSMDDPQFLNHVCKLQKALYGLKQALWAWFDRFSFFLLKYGFFCSKVDPSLFICVSHHLQLTFVLKRIMKFMSFPQFIVLFVGLYIFLCLV